MRETLDRRPATGDRRPATPRIWRGRTTRERADEYERYNYEAGIVLLIDKALGVQTYCEDRNDETEFMTISHWASVEAMATFTGSDLNDVHHLERGAAFLIELPESVQVGVERVRCRRRSRPRSKMRITALVRKRV